VYRLCAGAARLRTTLLDVLDHLIVKKKILVLQRACRSLARKGRQDAPIGQ